MPLKGIILRVTFPKVPRYGVMAINLLTTLKPCTILLQRGIVAYQIEPPSSVSSIPLDVCSVSQLKRCFNVSLHELILSCSILRRSIPVKFLSVVTVLDKDLESKDVKINMMQEINIPMKCNLDREDRVSFVSPLSSYLTS